MCTYQLNVIWIHTFQPLTSHASTCNTALNHKKPSDVFYEPAVLLTYFLFETEELKVTI